MMDKTMKDRILLAEAMGWKDVCNLPLYGVVPVGHSPDKPKLYQYIPDPFTDANDERAVLHFMREQIFSVRHRFFSWLDYIVQERLETKEHAAWPAAMIFMFEGDMARAALLALDKEPQND